MEEEGEALAVVAGITMPAGVEATVAEEAVRTPATRRQQQLPATPLAAAAAAAVVVSSTGSRETTKARTWACKWAT